MKSKLRTAFVLTVSSLASTACHEELHRNPPPQEIHWNPPPRELEPADAGPATPPLPELRVVPSNPPPTMNPPSPTPQDPSTLPTRPVDRPHPG